MVAPSRKSDVERPVIEGAIEPRPFEPMRNRYLLLGNIQAQTIGKDGWEARRPGSGRSPMEGVGGWLTPQLLRLIRPSRGG